MVGIWGSQLGHEDETPMSGIHALKRTQRALSLSLCYVRIQQEVSNLQPELLPGPYVVIMISDFQPQELRKLNFSCL